MRSAKRSLLVLTGIGVASGFLSALFGVGGGLIVVPMLVIFMGFNAREATATSLAAIGITALAGVISFAVLEDVDWGAAALVGFPALFGLARRHPAPAPGHLAHADPAVRRLRRRGGGAPLLRMSAVTIILALVLGFGAGVLSGMFGVGGGILFVPTLVFVVGLGQLDAQATSLAAIIPVVAFGAWQQHHAGNVRWRVAPHLGVLSVLGVYGGRVAGNRARRGSAPQALRRVPARRSRAARLVDPATVDLEGAHG